jgi:hypothetical protein
MEKESSQIPKSTLKKNNKQDSLYQILSYINKL